MDTFPAPLSTTSKPRVRGEAEWAQLDHSAQRETRRLRLGALLLAVLIAISLPILRATLWVQTAQEALQVEGDTLADAFSELASLKPETWTFERNRLTAMLEMMARRHSIAGAMLVDDRQRVLATAGTARTSSAFVRDVPVLDSGVKVATVTVHVATGGLLASTAQAALVGALLGLATWWLMVRVVIARLESTVAQLQQARREAERAGQARTTFLATMSHEIRTPMNGVIGMTSLLRDTPLDEQQRHYLEIVRGSGETLLRIINDILDFSKVESGHVRLEPQVFSPEALGEEVLMLLEPLSRHKELHLRLLRDPSAPDWVSADVNRIRQVLVNLIGNAIKFSEAGDIRLRIEAAPPGRLRLSVEDPGIGMTTEQMRTIFDPFVQADASTSRRFGGTGLGLAITRRLVELMDGRIEVQSQPGRGSRFGVEIAVASAVAPPTPEPTAQDLSGRVVLIVDDLAVNVELVETLVRGWRMEPVALTDPQQALALVADPARRIDVAVLDMNMPGLDGHTLGRRLRALRPALPLVLLSSKNGAVHDDGLFNARLNKPVLRGLLQEALRGVLGGATMREPDTLARAKVEQLHAEAGLPTLASVRILVAEDNAINATVISALLARLGVASVDRVNNGIEAVDAARRQPFDVILMDMLMPEMDGLEATRRIRADAAVAQPWIVALTANVMAEDRYACEQAGMNDFLAKPLQRPELERALTRWRQTRAR